MARSRNIKPGFFVNDELGELKPATRLLFIGLWTVADREGRLKDRPKKIKTMCLPYDQVNVDSCLDELVHAGFIIRYTVNGERFIQILNWHKHQSPHHKEVQSEIPEFKEEIHSCSKHGSSMTDKHETCPSPAALIPDSLNLIPDSGYPSTHAVQSESDWTPPAFDQKSKFEEVWKLYPRREGKKQAFRHYSTSVKSEDDHQRILTALENYKALVAADNANRNGDPRPWQNGKTWFNNWQDYEQVDIAESAQEDKYDRVFKQIEQEKAARASPEEKSNDFMARVGGRVG